MQRARLIVTEAPKFCRKNMELTCYAEHFSLVLCSGSRQNKMTVQIVEGDIKVTTEGGEWRMWFMNAAKVSWRGIKKLLSSTLVRQIAEITGQAMLALVAP